MMMMMSDIMRIINVSEYNRLYRNIDIGCGTPAAPVFRGCSAEFIIIDDGIGVDWTEMSSPYLSGVYAAMRVPSEVMYGGTRYAAIRH